MSVTDRPTVAIVPTFLRSPEELDVTVRCLVSLAATAPQAAVLVLDDASPEPDLVDQLEVAVSELGFALHRLPENRGFAKTINEGLRFALDAGLDAVLVNADIEFTEPGWLERMLARTDGEGRPAAVVGARLVYENGLIQHAGIFFSLLKRDWFHRFHYGPAELPEALSACRCPVTGALQLIRHETLAEVGIYDEGYGMAYEDVDYCLRVFEAGLECIYEPSVLALHKESFFRKTLSPQIKAWHQQCGDRLLERWGRTDMTRWIPDPL